MPLWASPRSAVWLRTPCVSVCPRTRAAVGLPGTTCGRASLDDSKATRMFHTSLVPACPVVGARDIRDTKAIPDNCYSCAPLSLFPLAHILLDFGPSCTNCTHGLSSCFAPGAAAHAVRCSCGTTALFLPRVLLHARGTPDTLIHRQVLATASCAHLLCISGSAKILFAISAFFPPRS